VIGGAKFHYVGFRAKIGADEGVAPDPAFGEHRPRLERNEGTRIRVPDLKLPDDFPYHP
jgi:hypothetical protein